MDEDFDASLAIIADSQRRMADNLTFLSRLHAYALAMLVVTLIVGVVGVGGMCWLLTRHQGESAAMHELVLRNTQTIDAQTRALLERGR